jgi:hypothetical protein
MLKCIDKLLKRLYHSRTAYVKALQTLLCQVVEQP